MEFFSLFFPCFDRRKSLYLDFEIDTQMNKMNRVKMTPKMCWLFCSHCESALKQLDGKQFYRFVAFTTIYYIDYSPDVQCRMQLFTMKSSTQRCKGREQHEIK